MRYVKSIDDVLEKFVEATDFYGINRVETSLWHLYGWSPFKNFRSTKYPKTLDIFTFFIHFSTAAQRFSDSHYNKPVILIIEDVHKVFEAGY